MIRNTGMYSLGKGDLVLLSTRNLRLKGVPAKLQKRFVGPFQILDTVGQQAYRLALPNEWKIHPVFPCLLIKGLEIGRRTYRCGSFTGRYT